jgi:hypothetical protein
VIFALLVGCSQESPPRSSITPTRSDAAGPSGTATTKTDPPSVSPAAATPTPTPRATAPPSDKNLIRDIWANFTKAWSDGPAGAEKFLETNNYPPYQKDSDLCRRSDEQRGVTEKVFTLDEKTVGLDRGWVIPEGSLKGRKPAGRVYAMKVSQLVTTKDGSAAVSGETHVSIDDGKAYLFLDCARIASASG